jgi:hypothetical protein
MRCNLIHFQALLRIRIRKDPKLLAGSISDPEPKIKFGFGFELGSETGSERNLSKEPVIHAKIRQIHTCLHISNLLRNNLIRITGRKVE